MTTVKNFSDILISLEEFFDVCQELGLRTEAEAGRFGAYRSRIAQLNDEIRRPRAGDHEMDIYKKLAKTLPHYLVALSDSREIGSFVPFLRACPPSDLAPKVRALLTGPELMSEENQASNQARNIQFELWLATTLWRVGVEVELAEPDLRCKIGDATVLFACKRLLSVKKLNRRINEATEQLRRNLKALPEDGAWGFVAISLSRILTNMSQSEPIADRSEGLQRLESRIEALITRGAKWSQTREAQGVVFHLTSMFTNAEANRIESGGFLTLYGDGPVCAALAARLQSAAVN
jgi:hypothetical protein